MDKFQSHSITNFTKPNNVLQDPLSQDRYQHNQSALDLYRDKVQDFSDLRVPVATFAKYIRGDTAAQRWISEKISGNPTAIEETTLELNEIYQKMGIRIDPMGSFGRVNERLDAPNTSNVASTASPRQELWRGKTCEEMIEMAVNEYGMDKKFISSLGPGVNLSRVGMFIRIKDPEVGKEIINVANQILKENGFDLKQDMAKQVELTQQQEHEKVQSRSMGGLKIG